MNEVEGCLRANNEKVEKEEDGEDTDEERDNEAVTIKKRRASKEYKNKEKAVPVENEVGKAQAMESPNTVEKAVVKFLRAAKPKKQETAGKKGILTEKGEGVGIVLENGQQQDLNYTSESEEDLDTKAEKEKATRKAVRIAAREQEALRISTKKEAANQRVEAATPSPLSSLKRKVDDELNSKVNNAFFPPPKKQK